MIHTLSGTVFRALLTAVAAQQGFSATPPLPSADVMKLRVRNLTIRTAQLEFALHNGVAVNYHGFED